MRNLEANFFGPTRHMRSHHTNQCEDGLTYGGNLESYAAALHTKQRFIQHFREKDDNVAVRLWESATVTYLEEHHSYRPWGVGGRIYTHGEDDGFHGSTIADSTDFPLLTGSYQAL